MRNGHTRMRREKIFRNRSCCTYNLGVSPPSIDCSICLTDWKIIIWALSSFASLGVARLFFIIIKRRAINLDLFLALTYWREVKSINNGLIFFMHKLQFSHVMDVGEAERSGDFFKVILRGLGLLTKSPTTMITMMMMPTHNCRERAFRTFFNRQQIKYLPL